jgi:hypothetical protein
VNRVNEILREVGAEAFRDPQLRPLLLDPPSVMGVETIDLEQVNVRMVARTLPGKQFDVGRDLRARVVLAFRREGLGVPAATAASPTAESARRPRRVCGDRPRDERPRRAAPRAVGEHRAAGRAAPLVVGGAAPPRSRAHLDRRPGAAVRRALHAVPLRAPAGVPTAPATDGDDGADAGDDRPAEPPATNRTDHDDPGTDDVADAAPTSLPPAGPGRGDGPPRGRGPGADHRGEERRRRADSRAPTDERRAVGLGPLSRG